MTAPRASSTPSKPWHREGWVWFLIALPLSAVVASLVTVGIAAQDADSLVKDDWYRAGKTINRTLERDEQAKVLGLHATMRVEEAVEQVVVLLSGQSVEDVSSLRLELDHPTLASRDLEIILRRDAGSGAFRGTLTSALQGRWYATLTPVEVGRGGNWRLARRVEFPFSESISFDLAAH